MSGVEQKVKNIPQDWSKRPLVGWIFAGLLILAIGGLAVLWQLGSTGLVDETEPLFAEAARQMTVTGDWVTPYFNGDTRFDKPPLVYWLMVLFYQTIGVNEWAVRLPSALSAIALMGMGFYILRRFSTDPEANPAASRRWIPAFIGSALMGLHPSTIIWARTGVSDMLLSGCIGLALMTFFCGYASQPPIADSSSAEGAELAPQPPMSAWYLACYLFIALAILTKGPIGIVLPGLIIGAFLLYLGNGWTVLREMRLLWGVGVIVAIALPWFILVTLANGEAYINSFFGYHNVERFTSVVNRHRAPWYFYFGVVLAGFAPWSLFLPTAIFRGSQANPPFWKRSIWKRQPRAAQLGLFAWFWFAVVFLFFTIAVTKLPSYVLPLMPAAAILVALFWRDLGWRDLGWRDLGWRDQMPRPALDWSIRISIFLSGLLFLVLAGLMVYAPELLKGDKGMPNLPGLLQMAGLPVLGGAIAAITAILTLFLLVRGQVAWIWLIQVVGVLALITFVLMPAMFIVDSQRQLPLRQLAEVVVQAKQPGEELVMIGAKKPSLVFYSRQKVTFRPNSRTAVAYLRQVAPQTSEPKTMLVLASPEELEDIMLQPSQYQNLGRAGSYQLVRVPKQILAQLSVRQ